MVRARVLLPCLLSVLGATASAAARAQDRGQQPFLTGDQCALCHSVAPGANAMRSPTGDDVSPHGLWQGTMMANAFRDPFFQAQLAKESQRAGPGVQETCLRCHAPMAHHAAVRAGKPPPRLADLENEPLADDGVSCTMCHQISAEGLGEARTFSGRPVLDTGRRIFGPYADPAPGPMRAHVGYTPTHGPQMQRAALCGTCHTVLAEHEGAPFPEQTPYLEWRNSDFSDEGGRKDGARTCQQCHMPRSSATRIARNPMGLDFLIPVREDFAAHAFVGGNAFMLDLLREHRADLGVAAESAALGRMAAATRRQLGESTARLSIDGVQRRDGRLDFAVRVENLTGHKFPTGYPARRAWLQVQVRRGRAVVFESGAFGRDGRLAGIADELALPHVTRVEKPADVAVYELVALDGDGRPTTYPSRMVRRGKDTRLLPRGWRADGPQAAATAPVGTGGDADFVAGGDTVEYSVEVAGDDRLQIVAWLRYQPVPPAWVQDLRALDAEACKTFVRLYDAADKEPETVAVATRVGV